MRIGLKSLPGKGLFAVAALLLGMVMPLSAAMAETLPKVSWENRVSTETANGDIVDQPPFVSVNDIRLRAFSDMQSINLQQTLTIDHGEYGLETLHVFTVWQGGASQGEQLMLLSVTSNGILVVGPHDQDFESVRVNQVNSDSAPSFDLIGADASKPLARLDYFDGRLIKQ
jgi:hypothetical protein